MKSRAALRGRMSRMWVYCSSRHAKANKDDRAPHQRAMEIAPRAKKMASDEDLKIDSGFGLVGKICSPVHGNMKQEDRFTLD
jgi:hypothetical protein